VTCSVVIGGAGFIGSHLVEALLARGEEVTVADDLSNGRREWLPTSTHQRFVRIDVAARENVRGLTYVMGGADVVYHLAANPEARAGLEDSWLDLRLGTIATRNALEAARLAQVGKFVFASSGTVYGPSSLRCGVADLGCLPVSLYGAAKFAGEALVSAYSECFGVSGRIVRFGNVVGRRATHGAILDFCHRLRLQPDHLEVLGDGTQRKPYLHVTDAVRALVAAAEVPRAIRPHVMNVAPENETTVREIAEAVVAASPNPKAAISYGTESRGWPGDVSESRMLTSFRTSMSSREAMLRAVKEIASEVFGAKGVAA